MALDSFFRKWSDTKIWPNNKLPAENENVVIPGNWKLILDVDTPILEILEVNGLLIFD